MHLKTSEKWMIALLSVIILAGILLPLSSLMSSREQLSVPPTEQTVAIETLPTLIVDTTPPAPVTEPAPTLQSLMGSDYVQQISDTITMQMGNRMDKNPDIDYYPISENKPLSSYVQIGPDTAFEVDEEGCVIIQLPAGSVTDAAQGVQEFRIGVYA